VRGVNVLEGSTSENQRRPCPRSARSPNPESAHDDRATRPPDRSVRLCRVTAGTTSGRRSQFPRDWAQFRFGTTIALLNVMANTAARARRTVWSNYLCIVACAAWMQWGCGGVAHDPGTSAGAAGTGGTGGTGTGGAGAGGTGTGGTGTVGGSANVGGSGGAMLPGCYSPTQNLPTAYQPGAKGCACNSTTDAAVCAQGVALICTNDVWTAVQDGPCAPTVPADKPCGGWAGDTCSASEYCAYQAGAYCGGTDAQATCRPRPQACAADYAPVCGCDQKTYPNACDAARAGTGVYAVGNCVL
jgi:hypothetical protein